MTNEEAIKNLSFAKQVEDMLGEFGGGVKSSDLSKSLAMAIEALQQQPCEDAVSRQALIEKATSWDKHFSDSERCVTLTDIIEAHSVYPKPKTGHWIEYTKVIIPEPINKWKQAWKCSECDYGGQDDDEDGWLEWNYCPNCGADMRKKVEHEKG